MPPRKRNEILRVKRNEKSVDTSEGSHIGAGDDFTPTENRTNLAHDETADAALSHQGEDDGTSDNVDMEDALMNSLDTRVPEGHSWSDTYSEELATSLEKYAKKFYDERNKEVLNPTATDIELFDESIHKPENAKSQEQIFLIFQHLLQHYKAKQYDDGHTSIQPPMNYVLVEGNPGTGKTWTTKTLRNITRIVCRSNNADLASTPTGCSASLIDGGAHFRSAAIPTGKKMYKTPQNMESKDLRKIRVFRKKMSNVVSWFMDEHSMCGRAMFGWLKHRAEELRRPMPVIDEDSNSVFVHGDLTTSLRRARQEWSTSILWQAESPSHSSRAPWFPILQRQ